MQINTHHTIEELQNFYSGIVEFVNDEGIWITHHITGCKSLILWKYVASMHEEQVMFDDDPAYKEVIQEYREKKPEVAAKTTLQPFVDIKQLTELAKKAKSST